MAKSLDELLALDTYTDMTDDEINTLIEWKEQCAYNKGYADGAKENITEASAALLDTTNLLADEMRANFDNVIKATPELQVI